LSSSKQVGERLPSELELAKGFGVSRNVIREALKLLKERGLVTLKTGDGAFVTMPENDLFTGMLRRALAMQSIDASTTFEMSLILEASATRYAALRGKEVAFEQLREMNHQMRQCGDDLKERADLDVAFHKHIAECSGNALLAMFVSSMTDLRTTVIRYALGSEGGHSSGVDYHDKIVDALHRRDPDAAEDLMKGHLMESWRRYTHLAPGS
jgi:GntR family transcriptional repressor for pyruvate dehydrogenase complex